MQNIEKASASGAKPVWISSSAHRWPTTSGEAGTKPRFKHVATPQGGRQAAWQY